MTPLFFTPVFTSFLSGLRYFSSVDHQIPLCKGGSYNDHVSEDAPGIREFPEQEDSEQGSIYDLRIVKYGDVARRGMLICRRHRELPSGGRASCQQQADKLPRCHGCVIQQQIGQEHDR